MLVPTMLGEIVGPCVFFPTDSADPPSARGFRLVRFQMSSHIRLPVACSAMVCFRTYLAARRAIIEDWRRP